MEPVGGVACRARGIKAVAVTAGYMHDQPRREFYAKMDAANVDLKAFTDDFYVKVTGSRLQPVLDTLRYLRHETDVWFESTTLLIPGKNDSSAEITALSRWIARELGTDVPPYFSAFHPDYKMTDVAATPLATLVRARDIARAEGLVHVYTGNVHHADGDTTACAHCAKPLIVRDWYEIGRYRLGRPWHAAKIRRFPLHVARSSLLPVVETRVFSGEPGGQTMRIRQGHDVVVVGGGTAGAIAGIAAARTGAKTLLVEQYGSLGGVLTLGMSLKGVHDGLGHKALGGIGDELIRRARTMQGATAVARHPRHGSIMGQDPEAMKLTLMEMVSESGLQLLLHTYLVDALTDGATIQAVRVANKAGLEIIPARSFVDCTGDADLAAMAGGKFIVGRERDAQMQPVSAIFRVGGVELDATWAYLAAHPEDFEAPEGYPGSDFTVAAFRSTPGIGAAGFRALISRARAAGDYHIPRDDMGFNPLPGRREVTINITRVHGIDGTNPDDLTRAEVETQLQMLEGTRFLRKYVPGFEQCYVISSPFQVGIRETRHIQGSYVLTQEDCRSGRDFADQVARGAYPLDIHDVSKEAALQHALIGGGGTDLSKIDRSYGIPARCLVPLGVDNLTVGGRSLSASHEAAGSARGQPVCMATGHAAGTMAALAAVQSCSPMQLDAHSLQAKLREQGAVIERPAQSEWA